MYRSSCYVLSWLSQWRGRLICDGRKPAGGASTETGHLCWWRAHLDRTTAAGKDGPSPQPSPHRMGRGRTANPVNRRRVTSHPVPLSIRWREGETLARGLVVLRRCARWWPFSGPRRQFLPFRAQQGLLKTGGFIAIFFRDCQVTHPQQQGRDLAVNEVIPQVTHDALELRKRIRERSLARNLQPIGVGD